MNFKENKKNDLISDDEYTGKPTRQKLITSIIVCLVLTLAFLWLTKSLWNDFLAMENGDKDLEVNTMLYILYQIGGKWLACGLFIACAAGSLYQGFKSLIKIKNKDY